jgi:hypothetical protein
MFSVPCKAQTELNIQMTISVTLSLSHHHFDFVFKAALKRRTLGETLDGGWGEEGASRKKQITAVVLGFKKLAEC